MATVRKFYMQLLLHVLLELTGPVSPLINGFSCYAEKSSNFLNTAEVAFDIVSCHTPSKLSFIRC